MQIFHVLKPKTISKLLDASYVNQFHGFIRKRPYNFQIISFDFRLRSDSRSIKYFCGLFLIHEHVIRPYRTHQCGSKKWDHNSLLLTDCSKHIVLSITNLWTLNKVWCSEKDNKYQILCDLFWQICHFCQNSQSIVDQKASQTSGSANHHCTMAESVNFRPNIMKPLFKRLYCKITKVWKQVIMHEDKFDEIKSEFTDLFSREDFKR